MLKSNDTAFLDLTKLTLGAFIGSFVQRQTERSDVLSAVRRQGSGEGSVGSGGTVH